MELDLGDALGVMVFAPLVLFSQPVGRTLGRKAPSDCRSDADLVLVWLAFYGTARWEKQSMDSEIEADGFSIANRIQDRLITHREVLSSLGHSSEAMPVPFPQFPNPGSRFRTIPIFPP